MRRLQRHLSYANVMATIAVFGVLGTGGAYAANTVFSTDIVDGEVKSVDVLNNSLRDDDIGKNQVGTSEVADGGLETADVNAAKFRSGAVATLPPGSCDPSNNCFMQDVRGFEPVAKRLTVFGGGIYCLTPLTRNSDTDPAIVSVDDHSTVEPVGNASANWNSATGVCSAGKYEVHTSRIPSTAGEEGEVEAEPSVNVGFQIYVP